MDICYYFSFFSLVLTTLVQLSESQSCPHLNLKNGRVRIRSRGRMAHFRCLRGFQRVGQRFAVCLKSGQWSQEPPMCVTRGCPEVDVTPDLTIQKLNKGAILKFTCAPGLRREGPERVSCDGKNWNEPPPKCLEGTSLGCDFEAPGLCGWSQSDDDDFEWTWHRGNTPTQSTGPSFDHTTNTELGYYLFMESSAPKKMGNKARLASPAYRPHEVEGVCLEFYYHMYGPDDDGQVGDLDVFAKPLDLPTRQGLGASYNIFHAAGNHGDQWNKGDVDIPPQTEPIVLLFQGTRMKGWNSDIAIDDIKLYNCSDRLTTISPSLESTLETTSSTTTSTTSTTTSPTTTTTPSTTTTTSTTTPTTTSTTTPTTTPTTTTSTTTASTTTTTTTPSTTSTTTTPSPTTTTTSTTTTTTTTTRTTTPATTTTSTTTPSTTTTTPPTTTPSTTTTTTTPSRTSSSSTTSPTTTTTTEATSKSTTSPLDAKTFSTTVSSSSPASTSSSPAAAFVPKLSPLTSSKSPPRTTSPSPKSQVPAINPPSASETPFNPSKSKDANDFSPEITVEVSTISEITNDRDNANGNDVTQSVPAFFEDNKAPNAHDVTTKGDHDKPNVGQVEGSDSESSSKSITELMPLIVGVVAAVLVGAIVIGVLAWMWSKKQRQKEEKDVEDQMNMITEYVEGSMNG